MYGMRAASGEGVLLGGASWEMSQTCLLSLVTWSRILSGFYIFLYAKTGKVVHKSMVAAVGEKRA